MSEPKHDYVLCDLEPGLRLVSRDTMFILQTMETGHWENKFYYGWISEALKGYITYSLQRFADKDQSDEIHNLLKKVQQLDTKVSSLGQNMMMAWREVIKDPIENHIFEKNYGEMDDNGNQIATRRHS